MFLLHKVAYTIFFYILQNAKLRIICTPDTPVLFQFFTYCSVAQCVDDLYYQKKVSKVNSQILTFIFRKFDLRNIKLSVSFYFFPYLILKIVSPYWDILYFLMIRIFLNVLLVKFLQKVIPVVLKHCCSSSGHDCLFYEIHYQTQVC